MTVTEIIAIVCMAAGFFFLALGAIGVFTFPDFFTRLHAAGVGDTLGVLLVIIGMMVYTGLKLLTWKVLLIFIVLLLGNPFGTNMIMIGGVRQWNYKDYLSKQPAHEGAAAGEPEAREE